MSRSSTIPFKVISATCEGNGIGKGNDLPWSLKEEMAYFHRMTRTTVDRRLENALLMGRRTWESIPPQERPFPGRVSIVLSQTMCKETKDNVRVCRSYEEAVEAVDSLYDKIETCWVVGGSPVYEAALKHRRTEKLYITRIEKHFECDTYFPDIDQDEWEISEDSEVPTGIQIEDGIRYKFEVYRRRLQ